MRHRPRANSVRLVKIPKENWTRDWYITKLKQPKFNKRDMILNKRPDDTAGKTKINIIEN